MNILVTGGAGNVGGSLCRELVKNKNNKVDIIDNLSTGSKSKLPSTSEKNWSFIELDVNNHDDLFAHVGDKKYDFIFHYAAVVGVKRTLKNPKLVLNDVEGIKNILNLAKKVNVKRIFFSSSSEIYGEAVNVPQREDTTPLNSRLPYAIVKNIAESYFKTFKDEDDINYTIFRFFNTIGPLQSNDFVVTKFIHQALKNDSLTIYGDGEQSRTFCYIDDNIEATLKCMYENLYVNEVMNIGSDEEITMLELAKLVIKLTNSKSDIIHLPPLKEGDMRRRKPDISKMEKVLDRKILPIEKGILNTINAIKKDI